MEMRAVIRIVENPAFEEVQALAAAVGLRPVAGVEYRVGIYDGDLLIGMGALVGNILQGIAVDSRCRDEGISALVVTQLLKKAIELGRETPLFIFTKPQEARLFMRMGFRKVAEARPYAALLEWGRGGLVDYQRRLEEIARDKPGQAASVVMNCNPFTLGHRYLVERAAGENAWLYVLVVEADKSLFPFPVRFGLIEAGTSDIRNVTVVPGGSYIISELTFPSYFTREQELPVAQAALDLEIFSRQVAPSLKVVKRYVGEEPYCPLTAQYNRCMRRILPLHGIAVAEIPRLRQGGRFISASMVRELIRKGRLAETRELLPVTTYEYLVSPQATGVIGQIRRADSRH